MHGTVLPPNVVVVGYSTIFSPRHSRSSSPNSLPISSSLVLFRTIALLAFWKYSTGLTFLSWPTGSIATRSRTTVTPPGFKSAACTYLLGCLSLNFMIGFLQGAELRLDVVRVAPRAASGSEWCVLVVLLLPAHDALAYSLQTRSLLIG